MPFLHTSRGRFFYRQAPGNAPALVFLHGNLGTSAWWRPTLDLLPAGWRGLAFDALGSGHSDGGDRIDRFDISAQVLDLAACLAALALGRVHLVAHSTSTPAAVEYTLAHRDQVAALVLVGPTPAGGVQTPAEAYPLLERLPNDPDLLARAIHASAPSLDPESAQFKHLVEEARATTPLGLVASARNLDAWQPVGRLRQLTLPVLLVRGEHDLMSSEQEAEQTLLAIPGASNLEIFHGVGHSPMLENPQGFVHSLISFVSEDWGQYEHVRRQVGDPPGPASGASG
jgi:pimeloyl-ACP methyl ester carboxylesterase